MQVFVASKFDNRLKEFAERWEIDKYLAATGYLPSNVRPFFVALPKDRAIQSSSDWRKQMSEVDVSITKHMREGIKGGFDEERFASRIGFNNLKKFLEEELARRYREAAPHTLSVLVDRVESAARELQKAEAELRAAEDVAAVRATAVATDRVANLLLAYKGRSAYMASSRAAEDIARQMAREVLGPLLDMACARLAFVLRRMFDIAVDRATALVRPTGANGLTIPETPAPAANPGPVPGPGRFGMPYQSSSQGGEGYDEVIQRAERLFNRLRYSVAQQSAPTSLKAAFLDPLKARLGLEVALDLFARSDTDFMSMFASPSALQALQVKRDSLQKRTESLLRLKNEFQELSKVL
ncbi:dynamin-type G domain-containing protein [Haematococcus lacustris]|uniref:Dynamin-type G domain-containing protein n=1 Tax=Haematococcus lacustris TaxID=44745 RepID=A0A699ZHA1_HAELA|nr:dynamin-type G domain-containing protein [Haematococcus lacustris]